MADKVTNHPSFGAIHIDHVSGKHELFMSSVEHHHFIAITICEAEHHRDLHYDRVFPGKELIRVLLTPVQFGEMLTNANNGSGTPCTLQRVWDGKEYKSLPDPPQLTKKATYVDEFKADVDKVTKDLDAVLQMAKDMEAKPAVNKTERRALTEKVEAMVRNIKQNMPFILDSFNENVEKVTAEAKNEVEQYRRDVIERLGMKAFDAAIRSKELGDGESKDKK